MYRGLPRTQEAAWAFLVSTDKATFYKGSSAPYRITHLFLWAARGYPPDLPAVCVAPFTSENRRVSGVTRAAAQAYSVPSV